MVDAVRRIAGAWELVLPEIILISTACILFLLASFLVNERGEAPTGLRRHWGRLSLVALLAALWLWFQSQPLPDATLGPFRLDDLTWFIRGLSIATGIILLLANWSHVADANAAEHHACLLLIVAGTSLVAASNDLILLFLALELVSISTYLILFLGRQDKRGLEATLKYFLLSIFSSAFVLFGLSYLYGATGTTNITAMAAALSDKQASISPILSVTAAALIAGLGFRIAAVPFHFYSPDVFQGAANGGAAMLAFVPKIVGFVALVRLLIGSAGEDVAWAIGGRAESVLWVLAMLGMTVGNVFALVQTDLRRMLAYSSIAHAGYMLVGLAAAPAADTRVAGVPALLFYLVIYGWMTIGVFAILAAVRPQGDGETTTEDLKGLSRTRPLVALLMTVFLFSLIGLPPTAGFLGKLNLLLAAWSVGSPMSRMAAIFMAVNAAIAAWYYLRLVGVMYLQSASNETPGRLEGMAFVGAVLCAAGTIGVFAAPEWLWQAAIRSAS